MRIIVDNTKQAVGKKFFYLIKKNFLPKGTPKGTFKSTLKCARNDDNIATKEKDTKGFTVRPGCLSPFSVKKKKHLGDS